MRFYEVFQAGFFGQPYEYYALFRPIATPFFIIFHCFYKKAFTLSFPFDMHIIISNNETVI